MSRAFLVTWPSGMASFAVTEFPNETRAADAEKAYRAVDDQGPREARTITTVDSLSSAGGPFLVKFYNSLTGESQKGFHDLPTARRKVMEALEAKYPEAHTAGVDDETGSAGEASTTDTAEETSSDETTMETTAEAESSNEEGTDDMATKKAAKAAKKTTKTKKEGGVKKPGVIDALVGLLQNGGGTIDKLVSKLSTKFPDRGADAMKATVKIQVNRLKKSKEEGGRNLKVKSEQVEGSNEKTYWI